MSTISSAGSLPEPGQKQPLRDIYPTAQEFADRARKQMRIRILWGVVLAFVTALSMLIGGTRVDSNAAGVGYFLIPILVIIALLMPIILWHYPRAMLYLTVGAACLIEQMPTGQPDAITDRIPFFLNINTVVQTSLHSDFKAMPYNFFECFIFIAGACSLFQTVFTTKINLKPGTLLWPILGYLFFVCIGVVVGLGTGGNYKIVLEEIRSQFYLLLVYLMTVNLVTERKHYYAILWIFAITVAIKGVLYTFRRFVTLHGVPLTDQGVGSHEEAYFFDCFIMLLMVLLVCGSFSKLRTFMLLLLPFVELGNLATNRRAGTAALAIAVPVVFLAAYQGFPKRRRMVAITGVSFMILLTCYYAVFKNSNSVIAQPARAMQSQFNPDERDAGSNAYRDAENIDQMATIRSAPLGYGYGKHFFHVAKIVDISNIYEWWDLIPHNSILWIWLRTGTLGFIAFWIMISTSVIYCAHLFRDDSRDLELRTIGLYGMLVVGAQLIFGLLDIQMVNPRDIMFTATVLGLAACAKRLPNLAPAIALPRDSSSKAPFDRKVPNVNRDEVV